MAYSYSQSFMVMEFEHSCGLQYGLAVEGCR